MARHSNTTLSTISWDVRGLNDSEKCDTVRLALPSPPTSIICFQETKPQSISRFKACTFLPATHSSSFVFKPSIGASGGILIAWADSTYVLLDSSNTTYSVSATLASRVSGDKICVTNVYGPCTDPEKPDFLEEINVLSDSLQCPWVLLGDFNLIRSPSDRSNDNFDPHAATLFNDAIQRWGGGP